MSSSSSHSISSHSTDESGYVTGRPRGNPLNIRENENPRSTESEKEVSSERDPYIGPRVSPTSVLPQPTPIIVQPNHRGPRVRQTARKSVPIPRRVTFRTERPEAPEPQRMATGMPIGQASGMAWARDQHIRAMMTELHGCQVLESVRTARRTAMRAELTCVIGGVVLAMLVLMILIVVYLGWF